VTPAKVDKQPKILTTESFGDALKVAMCAYNGLATPLLFANTGNSTEHKVFTNYTNHVGRVIFDQGGNFAVGFLTTGGLIALGDIEAGVFESWYAHPEMLYITGMQFHEGPNSTTNLTRMPFLATTSGSQFRYWDLRVIRSLELEKQLNDMDKLSADIATACLATIDMPYNFAIKHFHIYQNTIGIATWSSIYLYNLVEVIQQTELKQAPKPTLCMDITTTHPCSILCFQMDESKIVVGLSTGYIQVWDPHTGAQLCTLPDHHKGLSSLYFDKDKMVTLGSSKMTVWYFDKFRKLYFEEHPSFKKPYKKQTIRFGKINTIS
jgi:WD40 repeat protein